MNEFKITPVFGFMKDHVLFQIREFNIDLCDPDLKVDPYRDYAQGKCGEADQMGERHPEKGWFWIHDLEFWIFDLRDKIILRKSLAVVAMGCTTHCKILKNNTIANPAISRQ
jgi:hypothetical protein